MLRSRMKFKPEVVGQMWEAKSDSSIPLFLENWRELKIPLGGCKEVH